METYDRARQATDLNIIQRMRIGCWIIKAIYIHSEYARLTAFPQQQWLCERAWMYIAPLVITAQSVYCSVRTESLNIIQVSQRLKNVKLSRIINWNVTSFSLVDFVALFWL